jgi:hypothetical protein
MEARLVLPDKRTLVGNLLRATSSALGFGQLSWMERALSLGALRGWVLTPEGPTEPKEEQFAWQPEQVTGRYTVSGVRLDQVQTVHADVLVHHLVARNDGTNPRTLSLLFLSEFEGRKASAVYQPNHAQIDLSVSQRVHVALASSRTPDRVSLRPYPSLVERDLIAPDLQPPLPRGETFHHDQIVLGWRFDLSLAPNQSMELTLALTCDPVGARAAAQADAVLAEPAAAFRAETDAWEHYWQDEIPVFHCSNPDLERLWLYTWFVQRSNCVNLGQRRFPWRFQVPSKHTYPHLWFWDSAFHALVTRWLRDPRLAHDDLRTAAIQQYPDGMIPHETYLEPDTAWGNWPDGDGQSSSVTQLPIFAHAVWETFRVTRDRALLSDLYPALVRYDDWLRRERDRDGDGLVTLVHRWEGWDTSPRWDWGLDVEPVDVNCFYFAQKQALAKIAEELGDPTHAAHYRQDAERVAEAIRGKMWDPEAQTFFDLRGEKEIPVRVRTPAALIALPFGIADPAQADALIAQLADPNRFWAPYPVPTVALDEPTFSPRDYWRGPVWINQNWLIIDGLRRYHREDLAGALLRRTFDLLTREGHPSNREYFDPLTGEGLGAVDLGWTGLCNDLIIRHVCGVQPEAPQTLSPLDIGLDWYELHMPWRNIHARFDRKTGPIVTPRL